MHPMTTQRINHHPIHWPARQTMIRMTMLAFAMLTIMLGAVVVGQEQADAASDLAAIGRDTPVRITVWLYIASMAICLGTGWKASKWDSARGNKIEKLQREHKELIREVNALKAQRPPK